jgi:dihydrofolate reductase
MTTNPATTEEAFGRVVAEIVLSLDGRVNGAGGESDMSWLFPHAISDTSRDRTVGFTQSSTTALIERKNYESFAGYWPSVADDESADLRDRTFSRWFTSVQKVVFSTSLTDGSLPNTTVTSDPPAQVVAKSSRRTGRGHHRAGEQQRDPPAAWGRCGRPPEHHAVPRYIRRR